MPNNSFPLSHHYFSAKGLQCSKFMFIFLYSTEIHNFLSYIYCVHFIVT